MLTEPHQYIEAAQFFFDFVVQHPAWFIERWIIGFTFNP